MVIIDVVESALTDLQRPLGGLWKYSCGDVLLKDVCWSSKNQDRTHRLESAKVIVGPRKLIGAKRGKSCSLHVKGILMTSIHV